MLKWIAVFKYFEYAFDEKDRAFELNTFRIRQEDLVRNLKQMFNQITFGFPFKEIVKEQKRVDSVSEETFDGIRDSLRHLRRDVKTARENLSRQIQEYVVFERYPERYEYSTRASRSNTQVRKLQTPPCQHLRGAAVNSRVYPCGAVQKSVTCLSKH